MKQWLVPVEFDDCNGYNGYHQTDFEGRTFCLKCVRLSNFRYALSQPS